MTRWKFQREEKYIVIKLDDIKKYLDSESVDNLNKILNVVRTGRAADNKTPENRYVIVNQKEDYIEEVWSLIELGERAKIIQEKIDKDPKLQEFWNTWYRNRK